MKKSRFSEEQIIGMLREGQGGGTVKSVCAKNNVSEQTYYGWKPRYGGMAVDEVRKVRALDRGERTFETTGGGRGSANSDLGRSERKKW